MMTRTTRPRTAVRRGVEAIVQDARFALRSFGVNPAFTCTAVLTLGLGIAAATSVLSVVDATLVRPLPFPNPDRVADVSQTDSKTPQFRFGVARVQAEALRTSPSFEAVAEYTAWPSQPYTAAGSDGPQVINGVHVSPDFFKVFRVQPVRGRAFTSDDEGTAQPAVCVLTSSGLRRLFNAQPEVIGRTLSFVEGQLTVVGVMGDHFWYPMSPNMRMGLGEPNPDLLVPFARRGQFGGPDSVHTVAARLKPGATMAQAERDADVVLRRHPMSFPGGPTLNKARVRELQRELAGRARSTLLTLFGVAGCLLLICSVNIANLLLSRSHSRTRELALRTTLGAGRPRLFRQLLTEYLVLAATGGVVGLYLTVAAMDTFLRLLPKGLLLVPTLGVDARTAGIAALVTLVTGLLSGLGPALVATRADLARALKAGGHVMTRTPRWRSFTGVLLVVETAVLLILLSGGALLVNTLVRLKTIDLGFAPDRLWTAEFAAPPALYPEAAQIGPLAARMSEALRRLPGVVSVGESDWGLLGGFCPGNSMTIDGQPAAPEPQVRHVSASYFATVNVGPSSGRIWATEDENVKPQVAVINATAARLYWPNQDPIGRRITVNEKWPVRIIGVVRDLREANERQAPGPSVYLPLNPFSSDFYNVRVMVVRTARAETGLGKEAVKALAAIEPRLPVTMIRADQTLSQRRQDPRFYAVFVGVAAVFGLLLAAVGFAGVTAQGVARYTKEIGIRLALGAEVVGIIRMVIRQVWVPVIVGIGLGIGGALAVLRVLKSFLYEITPQDPLTHVVAVGLLLGVALLAAFLPARRAAHINPLDSLRAE